MNIIRSAYQIAKMFPKTRGSCWDIRLAMYKNYSEVLKTTKLLVCCWGYPISINHTASDCIYKDLFRSTASIYFPKCDKFSVARPSPRGIFFDVAATYHKEGNKLSQQKYYGSIKYCKHHNFSLFLIRTHACLEGRKSIQSSTSLSW